MHNVRGRTDGTIYTNPCSKMSTSSDYRDEQFGLEFCYGLVLGHPTAVGVWSVLRFGWCPVAKAEVGRVDSAKRRVSSVVASNGTTIKAQADSLCRAGSSLVSESFWGLDQESQGYRFPRKGE
jgi:hypothetical protein